MLSWLVLLTIIGACLSMRPSFAVVTLCAGCLLLLLRSRAKFQIVSPLFRDAATAIAPSMLVVLVPHPRVVYVFVPYTIFSVSDAIAKAREVAKRACSDDYLCFLSPTGVYHVSVGYCAVGSFCVVNRDLQFSSCLHKSVRSTTLIERTVLFSNDVLFLLSLPFDVVERM